MFEQHNLTNEMHAVESRLRSVQPAPPRLDRDHLMFLAGQRSVMSPSRNRFWPTLTVISWMACAVVVGVFATRPPQVIVETRVVERIVEAPRKPDPTNFAITQQSPVVAEANRTTSASGPALGENDFRFLEDLRSPLTALASRPSLYQKIAEPTAIASVEPTASTAIPAGAKTYSELRRELLDDHREKSAPAEPLWWF